MHKCPPPDQRLVCSHSHCRSIHSLWSVHSQTSVGSAGHVLVSLCWRLVLSKSGPRDVFFLWNPFSIKNHDVSVFQDHPHHERLDFPQPHQISTFSNPKSHANNMALSWCFKKQPRLLPPAWPHRLQRIWSAFQTSALSSLQKQARKKWHHLTFSPLIFSVFSLSMSFLKPSSNSQSVTYLDKFLFSPRLDAVCWGSQAPSNRWIAKSPAFLGRPGSY